MWAGMERGAVTCGCGNSLGWVDREDIGPLQWHFLECELAPKKAIRKRWRAAVRTAPTAATTGRVVVEAIVACWGSRADGAMHTFRNKKSRGFAQEKIAQPTKEKGGGTCLLIVPS